MARIDLYQLDEFDQDFAPNKVARSVPMWDSVNNQFTPAYLSKSQHFGEEFQYTHTTTDVETTTTTPAIYLEWNTASLPIGTYLLFVQVSWRTSNNSTLLAMDLLKDGVSLFDHPQVASVGSNNNDVRAYVNGEGIFTVTTPGVVNFKINYSRKGATGTVYIFSGYIRIFRIS